MELTGMNGVRPATWRALSRRLESLLVELANDPDLAQHTPQEITAEVVDGLRTFVEHMGDGRGIEYWLTMHRENPTPRPRLKVIPWSYRIVAITQREDERSELNTEDQLRAAGLPDLTPGEEYPDVWTWTQVNEQWFKVEIACSDDKMARRLISNILDKLEEGG